LSEASATPPTTPKPKKKRGWLPRLLIAAGLGVSTLALTGFVGWAWLRSESGERLLTRQIEGAVQAMMTEGTFTIGELDTDLWGNLGVSDVHINDANGSSVIFLPRADVQLSLLPLLFDHKVG
jgi:autotransporter translocation and assembly factor TamB